MGRPVSLQNVNFLHFRELVREIRYSMIISKKIKYRKASLLSYTGCLKMVLRLINNGTKAFRSISEIIFVADEGDPNLDSDISFFSFR